MLVALAEFVEVESVVLSLGVELLSEGLAGGFGGCCELEGGFFCGGFGVAAGLEGGVTLAEVSEQAFGGGGGLRFGAVFSAEEVGTEGDESGEERAEGDERGDHGEECVHRGRMIGGGVGWRKVIAGRGMRESP